MLVSFALRIATMSPNCSAYGIVIRNTSSKNENRIIIYAPMRSSEPMLLFVSGRLWFISFLEHNRNFSR